MIKLAGNALKVALCAVQFLITLRRFQHITRFTLQVPNLIRNQF